MPSLEFWILNVGHGDSIVIRCSTSNGAVYGLVDSSSSGGGTPPALRKLLSLGAKRLSFVMLTHPHVDHFKGMFSILKHYRGMIDSFISFPALRFFLQKKQQRNAMFEKVKDFDGSLPAMLAELLEIMSFLKTEQKNGLSWDEYVGPENTLFLPGFENVECNVLQPLPRAKGEYNSLIEKSDLSAIRGDQPNAISLALRMTLGGTSVVLGGDSTFSNWHAHRRQTINHGYKVGGTAWKIPHHGSHRDVRADMLNYWFVESNSPNQRVGIISADGRSHPHPQVLSALQAAGIHPYCTNLAKPCGGSIEQVNFSAPGVPKELREIINSGNVEVPATGLQACQGEIYVRVDASGRMAVTPEISHPCEFRGDYKRLVSRSLL